MTTRVKTGENRAKIRDHALAVALMVLVVDQVFASHGYDAVITSAGDEPHGRKSRHYSGDALDYRTRDIPQETLSQIRHELMKRLGPDFDVVLEKSHLHLEYDPSR